MSLWRSISGKLSRLQQQRVPVWLSRQDILESTRPKTVGCETTNICNANCTFCGYGKGKDGKAADERNKSKLNEEVLHHTLKLFSEAGGGIFNLGPILGENTVHPKWVDYIKTAKSYPHITGVSCYTNAILLHKFGYREILTAGLSSLSISTCLSGKEAYKRIYGVDQYEQVVENILGMLKTNQELGTPVYIFLLLRIDKPYSDFYASDVYKNIRKYLPENQVVIQQDDWDDFKGLIKQDGLPLGNYFKKNLPLSEKKEPCYALYRKLQVLQDGTLQGCSCRVEPELWGGNIKDYDTLQEAWRDKNLETVRNNWFDGTLPNCCQECTHYIPYSDLITKEKKQGLKTYLQYMVIKVRNLFSKNLIATEPVQKEAPSILD